MLETDNVLIEAHCADIERGRCRCGKRATSELSYAKEINQRASPAPELSPSSEGSSLFLPADSPVTDTSYQSPVVSQVTALVPIPEEAQLPSPTTSEDKIVRVLAPRVDAEVPQVSGQRCWTACKAQCSEGPGVRVIKPAY